MEGEPVDGSGILYGRRLGIHFAILPSRAYTPVMAGEFSDRSAAGRLLAEELLRSGEDLTGAVVLALARGGVPVGAAVAAELGLPLEVAVVRKLGFPSFPEVAMGAIGEDGVRVLDEDLVRRMGVTDAELAEVEHAERDVLAARASRYRNAAGGPRDLSGRIVLIVDDGVATGATAEAACRVARRRGADRVIVASPVCGADAESWVPSADRMIGVLRPPAYRAVGDHYRRFEQVGDDEVMALIRAFPAP